DRARGQGHLAADHEPGQTGQLPHRRSGCCVVSAAGRLEARHRCGAATERGTMNQRIIVHRDSLEALTFAVVEFSGCQLHELLGRLRKALGEWSKTDAGRQAVDAPEGDFNVGNLANYTPAGMGYRNRLSECLR